MKRRQPDSTAEVLRLARQLGWQARRTRNGWWLTHPDGGQTSFHGRCTDWRAWRNITARLYRTRP
jgi:hypothetical protein